MAKERFKVYIYNF